jgi:peptidoglycan/LPS O-acetylase OafA/YrhL
MSSRGPLEESREEDQHCPSPPDSASRTDCSPDICSSIHSFILSTPTLHANYLEAQDDYDDYQAEKDFDYFTETEPDPEIERLFSFTTRTQAHNPQPPSSWRQTPLTVPALSRLAVRTLISLALLLPPSFIYRPGSSPSPSPSPSPPTRRLIHATSHLDGLRGVAALIVFLDHFVLNWYHTLRNGYLSSPNDTYTLQLPIVRLLLAGRASVAVFFGISGFVLSYKPLQLMRAKKPSALLDTLASSVFRRGIRLYVPIIFGTLISAYLAQKGAYTPVPTRTEIIPPQLPTLHDQMHHWYHSLQALILAGLAVDPNTPNGPVYNGHLWTIPIEFFGSMAVFLMVLGTAKMESTVRMVILGIISAAGLCFGRWDLGLFIGGVVLAELSLVGAESENEQGEGGELSSQQEEEGVSTYQSNYDSEYPITVVPDLEAQSTRRSYRPSTLKAILSISLVTLSLYLLSYPGESPSPGSYHPFLASFAPNIYQSMYLGSEHFFLSLGALLLIFTLTYPALSCPSSFSLPTLIRRSLNSPVAQYLGDISYSLYIVHGMVLFTLGTGLQERWTGQVGELKWVDNGLGELVEAVVRVQMDEDLYWKAFLLCGFINLLVVLWASDLFWRAIDRRAVRMGRWVQGAVCGGFEEK